jgi:hypothetical protein
VKQWRKRDSGGRADAFAAATDLAQMGVCEKRMLFEATLGKRRSATQERDSGRGTARHDRFHRDAVRYRPEVKTSEPRSTRCFVATAVFGESAETQTLRQFRDTVLMRHCTGRAATALYYLVGPWIADFLLAGRRRQAIARALLRPVVRTAGQILESRRNRRGNSA